MKTILDSLHRTDRYLAVLSVDENIYFDFKGPYFITEVFCYLPDKDTDISSLNNASVYHPEYGEESKDEINRNEFVALLDKLSILLEAEEKEKLTSTGYKFRTTPKTHLKTIAKAKLFIEKNKESKIYLTYSYEDEHL